MSKYAITVQGNTLEELYAALGDVLNDLNIAETDGSVAPTATAAPAPAKANKGGRPKKDATPPAPPPLAGPQQAPQYAPPAGAPQYPPQPQPPQLPAPVARDALRNRLQQLNQAGWDMDTLVGIIQQSVGVPELKQVPDHLTGVLWNALDQATTQPVVNNASAFD